MSDHSTGSGTADPPPTPRPTTDDLAYDRTHLASERTFAAWLRTGLAVAAGGIAIARLVPEPARGSLIALALGACFVLLGIAITAYGARQFAVTTTRLCKERSRPIPTTPRGAYALTIVVSLLLLAVLLFLWTHRGRTQESDEPAAPSAITAPPR